jgi:hypothetical protein
MRSFDAFLGKIKKRFESDNDSGEHGVNVINDIARFGWAGGVKGRKK